MLSFESLRNTTCIATIPAANGDFFGNFSLYKAASVHGCAEIVSPSWVSKDAVFNALAGRRFVAHPHTIRRLDTRHKKGTALDKFRIEL